MNTFGDKFRVTLFGESHGPAVGVVIDGVPPGIELCADDFRADMQRRSSGAVGTTARVEEDIPELLSGIYSGRTTGAPLAILFPNRDIRPDDYSDIKDHPRPSHADWVARTKYNGFNDPRGGGHFSGRLTAPLVAAAVVAKKVLGLGVRIEARITEIGGVQDETLFPQAIERAAAAKDSVGGVIECRAIGVGTGYGEPFFNSVESVVSHLLFSIPGIRGVEFGSGFAAARMAGSEHNDPIISADGTTLTNHAGGIVGGLTNGNPIVLRVAVKPTASIGMRQQTLNVGTGTIEPLEIRGRHDCCIALRMPVVIEAAVAIALAQFI